jgi:hypothetical protein
MPQGTTNVCGAMCKGLSAVERWLMANPKGFATVLITSDGEFNTNMEYEECEDIPKRIYTRTTIGPAMVKMMPSGVALHFIGVNSGSGSTQLCALRDAFKHEFQQPILHEFGEDTNTQESVRRVFPRACGALTLRVQPSGTFGYIPITLFPGNCAYIPGAYASLTILDAFGCPVTWGGAEGVETEDIIKSMALAARESAFKKEIQHAMDVDPSEVPSVLTKFKDLRGTPCAEMVRQASSNTSADGSTLSRTNVLANLRAVSSQM